MSDFEIVVEIGKQFDMEEALTDGKTIADMQKKSLGVHGR